MENLMMVNVGSIKERARNMLKGNLGSAIVIALLSSLILIAAAFTFIGAFLLAGVFLLGTAKFYMNCSREGKGKIDDLFSGFSNFINGFVAYLLQCIFTTLWSMLFIIPGLVKVYSYSMTYYILNDNPGMGGNEAITLSRKMMDGYKGKLFLLHLSFFGWFLLVLATFGIALLYVGPYVEAANAAFYDELKAVRFPNIPKNPQGGSYQDNRGAQEGGVFAGSETTGTTNNGFNVNYYSNGKDSSAAKKRDPFTFDSGDSFDEKGFVGDSYDKILTPPPTFYEDNGYKNAQNENQNSNPFRESEEDINNPFKKASSNLKKPNDFN